MATVFGSIYNAIFRSNTVMLGTVFGGAFAFELMFDTTSNKVWDAINRGRQWKDIKQRYMQPAEDDDDE